MTQTERIERLQKMGFDATAAVTGGIRVRCSQCVATTINGTPCHETNCPNARHECSGCNAQIPVNIRYCGDCRG